MISGQGSLAVKTRNVRRSFAGRDVLTDVDLEIRRGEFVALLGPSGCGKSTLLRAISGLDVGVTGEIQAPANCSVVFQEPRLLPWKRVWKNVALGLNGDSQARRRRALTALSEVSLSARSEAWPITLSGGEAQRVALARALVQEPELLLLDEPFGALDALTKIRMHALLARLLERHRPAVLLVTHDVDEAILLADRAVVLARPGGSPEGSASRVVADLPVRIDSPRHRSDPKCVELRRQLLGYLGVEDNDGPAETSSVRAPLPSFALDSSSELELANATG